VERAIGGRPRAGIRIVGNEFGGVYVQDEELNQEEIYILSEEGLGSTLSKYIATDAIRSMIPVIIISCIAADGALNLFLLLSFRPAASETLAPFLTFSVGLLPCFEHC
jgi:hypothetical protein